VAMLRGPMAKLESGNFFHVRMNCAISCNIEIFFFNVTFSGSVCPLNVRLHGWTAVSQAVRLYSPQLYPTNLRNFVSQSQRCLPLYIAMQI